MKTHELRSPRSDPEEPRVPSGEAGAGQWTIDSWSGSVGVATSPNIRIAAGLQCDGFPSGCQSGGTYGMSGMYNIGGRILCTDCAVKYFGLQGEPYSEKARILAPFVIGK